MQHRPAHKRNVSDSKKVSIDKLLIDIRPYSATENTIAFLAKHGLKTVPWSVPDKMIYLLNQLVGDFTWTFGAQFFIETEIGNFVWNDPDYSGNNVIRRYVGTYAQFRKGVVGRHKGKKFIEHFCVDPTGRTKLSYNPKWVVPNVPRKKVVAENGNQQIQTTQTGSTGTQTESGGAATSTGEDAGNGT